MKKIIMVLSLVVLLASIGVFGYMLKQNNQVEEELAELKGNITKVKDKITNLQTEKQEKETEYEKLEKEMKEKLEELNVWKETKAKLEKSLS